MEVKLIKLSKIKVNDKNPRTITEDKLRRLVESILVFPKMLTIRPIVVDDKGVALGGNMRTRALKEIKKIGRDFIPERLQQIRQYANKTQEEKNELLAFWNEWFNIDSVPVIYADTLTEEEKREFIIKDNSSFGAWDWDVLANEWESEQLEDWGVDVWTADENENDAREVEVQEDDFDVCDEQPSIVKRGEVWQLGEHRLMCGDSTDADAVAKLMNGEKADLSLTDPPYGVAVVQHNSVGGDKPFGSKGSADRGDKMLTANTYAPIIGDETTETARKSYDIMKDVSDNQIIFGGNYFTDFLSPKACWVVWDKKNTGNFADVELAWTSFDKGAKLYSWTWNGMIRQGDSDVELKKRIHPTQKPVGMLGAILQDFTKDGSIILDLFGGSGSTMIACEQLGRKCRMMELDPHYCTVIIARWEQFTGKQAVKIE